MSLTEQENAYLSGAHEFPRVYCEVHVANSLVFRVVFGWSLFVFFVIFPFVIALSVLLPLRLLLIRLVSSNCSCNCFVFQVVEGQVQYTVNVLKTDVRCYNHVLVRSSFFLNCISFWFNLIFHQFVLSKLIGLYCSL